MHGFLRGRYVAGAAILLLCGADAARAGSATTTFTTTASISSGCTLSATSLSFGTYTPSLLTALTGTSTITVYCTLGSAYTLSLNVGTGGGSFTSRSMANGTYLLGYNLYTSLAHTTVWGDGTGATATVAGVGLGLLTGSPNIVYGNIPIAEDMPTGAYSSTITVTVNY